MPHPKNHIKLTGDTHPPEVEYDLDLEDETDEQPEAWSGSQALRTTSANLQDYGDAAVAKARAQPLMAIGLMLAAGYVLAKLLRR